MEFNKESEDSILVTLTPKDVAEAIAQYIKIAHPQYASNWDMLPKFEVGAVVMEMKKFA